LKRAVIQTLKFLAFFILGLLLLYLAFRNTNLEDLRLRLQNAEYKWLILAFIFSALGSFSRARRWVILIRSIGYTPRLMTTFHSVMTGYLANMALPRMGEVTRCVMLGKREKIPLNKLVGTVILERFIDMVSLIIILIVVIITGRETIGPFFRDDIMIPIGSKIAQMFGDTHAIRITSISIIVLALILLFLFRKKILGAKLYLTIREFIRGIFHGLRSIITLKHKWEFLFHTIFIWFCYMLMTWVVVFVIPSTSHLTFGDGVVLLVIGGLGMSAPVQSGLGAFHYIVSRGLLLIYAIPLEEGLAYALISHTSQMIFIAVMGIISLNILFAGIRKAGK
jgi:glycosyltransferase 2 family protein